MDGRGVSVLAIVFVAGCGDGGQSNDGGTVDVVSDAVDASVQDVQQDAGGEADAEAGPPLLSCDGEAPSESNFKEITATVLGTIDDCDSSGSTYSDVMAGTYDVAWYHYTGTSPVNLCIVDPTVTIDTVGMRLCEFAACTEGTTTIDSCGVGTPATSPAGLGGCCTMGTSSMTMKITCSSVTNAADIYIRADQPTSNACIPYNVAYHF